MTCGFCNHHFCWLCGTATNKVSYWHHMPFNPFGCGVMMCVTETGPYFWLIFFITFIFMPVIMFLFALMMCLVVPGIAIAECFKGGRSLKQINSKPIRVLLVVLYMILLGIAYLLMFAVSFALVMAFMALTIIPGYFY